MNRFSRRNIIWFHPPFHKAVNTSVQNIQQEYWRGVVSFENKYYTNIIMLSTYGYVNMHSMAPKVEWKSLKKAYACNKDGKSCKLFLEKLIIGFPKPSKLLNRGSEWVSKSRHENVLAMSPTSRLIFGDHIHVPSVVETA